MKKPLLAVVLTVAALAAFVNVGVKLAGALRQVGIIGSTKLPVPEAPHAEPAQFVARPERAPVAVGVAGQTETKRETAAIPPPEPSAREAEQPAAEDLVVAPSSGFDPEVALHAAADADPNVAALLDDSDPAVGAAVRDFVYTLSAPAASAGSR